MRREVYGCCKDISDMFRYGSLYYVRTPVVITGSLILDYLKILEVHESFPQHVLSLGKESLTILDPGPDLRLKSKVSVPS